MDLSLQTNVRLCIYGTEHAVSPAPLLLVLQNFSVFWCAVVKEQLELATRGAGSQGWLEGRQG